MPPLRINKITRGETMLEFASKNHTACEAMRVDMDDLLFRIAAGEQAALAQLYEHTCIRIRLRPFYFEEHP